MLTPAQEWRYHSCVTVESNTDYQAKRKQFSVRFAEAELRELNRMATEDGLPVATFIRWLAREERKRRMAQSSAERAR